MALWEGNRAAPSGRGRPARRGHELRESSNLCEGVQDRKRLGSWKCGSWELALVVGSWQLGGSVNSQRPTPNDHTDHFAGGGGAFFCSAISEFQFFSMFATHAL